MKVALTVYLVPIFALIAWLFVWYGCRIEPGNGQIAVLIKKCGKDLKFDEIIAPDSKSKGIQAEVLGEGRYFRNPFVWEWKICPVTDVPAGKFAVLVRKYGKALPAGEIIAPDNQSRGIVKEVLGTGRHRINPYAYEVKLFDDIKILPGQIGIVTQLTGKDIFSGEKNDFNYENGYLIKGNHKGVISQVLKSGTHRLNPFTHSVMLMNTRSQRHEFSGNDAITFLTLDGFTVSLEGTVEFNINEKLAPRLVQVVGDMNDILKKIILPSVHGFARIEGSKKGATEFIIGESRRLFQEELDKFLRKNCAKWGIVINSVLIRDIIVPQQIAEIIRKRELALQDARKYTQEITRAKSEAELAKQKTLAEQNKKKVAAETERLTAKIAAEQKQVEAVMAAQADLDVAKIDYETAKSEAKSVLNAAVAQSAVIKETKAKEAEVLARMVKAFGNGENFITGKIYEKIMPGINSIVLNSNNSSANSFGLPLLNNKKMEAK